MPRLPQQALLVLFAGVVATASLERDAWSADGDPAAAESTAAPALPGPTWDFEIGAKVAYTTPPIAGGTSPFGLGFGGRAGFAISHVYVGVSVLDYLGAKDVNVTDTALLYGAELGYDLRLFEVGAGHFKLRPRVGAGGVSVFRTDPSTTPTSSSSGRGRGRVDVVSSASGSSSSGSNVTTVDAFYVEPGATLMFVTGSFFFAIDGNTLVVPGIGYGGAAATTWLAYGLQGQSGLRF